MKILAKFVILILGSICVVPVLNFVAGFVNLVISCVYMMPMDFFELFKTIFVPTSIMMIYTVAYLFLGMFIEGKGIAFEKNDRAWFEKEFLND